MNRLASTAMTDTNKKTKKDKLFPFINGRKSLTFATKLKTNLMIDLQHLLNQNEFSKQDLIYLLTLKGDAVSQLFEKSKEIKQKYVGNSVYLRGLIEFSNICRKNCFYCGIRSGNPSVGRYQVTEDEVVEAAKFASAHKYGSLVLQSGERMTSEFTDTIARILERIHKETHQALGITLSLGEQTEETYRKWFSAGAKRYLLRIESSNRELFEKIHPNDDKHRYDDRIEALQLLKKVGYQVGTGIMIGLPFQTMDILAEDLLFFKKLDIDMVGMGPYLEHEETPLINYKDCLLPKEERLELSLKMLALLRILMKDINIAATTALQTLDPNGRKKAVEIAANVVMPNLTPNNYRENYFLYENKSITMDDALKYHQILEKEIESAGGKIAYDLHGDSLHFTARKN